MTFLSKQEFVCIDCESTGLDPEKDRIIEVAGIRFIGDEEVDRFEMLVDPECEIPESSVAIHHITQDMIMGKPTIAEVIPSILKFVGNRIIVGHSILQDINFLENAAKRANISCHITNNVTIDTLRMARLYGESPVNSLERLRTHFNIASEGAHRAMSDVLVNIDVFRQLSKRYKHTEDILNALSKPIALKIMPLGKHKGRPIKEVPLEYLIWAAKKPFDQDLLFTLRSEINRRKKGNLFTQAGNPFSEL